MCVDDALGLVLEPSKAIPIPFLAQDEFGCSRARRASLDVAQGNEARVPSS